VRKITASVIIVFASIILLSCASSIIDGEYIRTSSESYPPKERDVAIDVYLSGNSPDHETIDLGRVTARAWKLEKGMNELKKQARELGADAITNIIYERRFSVDYLQDIYFIDGDAVVWKCRNGIRKTRKRALKRHSNDTATSKTAACLLMEGSK